MLSYKDWKIVSEAFGAAMPLGISKPNAIGVVGSKLQNERLGDEKKSWDLRDIDLEDEEDVGLEDEEDVDMDMGDEDMDDVDMDDEDMDDEFDHPHGVHHDDEDMDDEDMDMDMEDEDDEDMDMEDEDDEDMDMEDMDMEDEDDKSPLLMMKRYITKYMKKEACHDNSGSKKKMLYSKKNLKKENTELRKENIELHEILSKVAEGVKGAAAGAGLGALVGGPIGAVAGGAIGSTIGEKKGQSKKQNKKMKKESNEFLKSLTDQGKGNVRQKWSSGLTEDALFALENPNSNWQSDSSDGTEAGPGEIGFAPQGRIGEIGGSEMPDLPTLGDDS